MCVNYELACACHSPQCVRAVLYTFTVDLFFSSDLSLPVGDGQGSVALYRTKGPFLHSIRLSYSPHRVQAGKTFVVEVSGNLAGRPDQPTGQLLLLLLLYKNHTCV